MKKLTVKERLKKDFCEFADLNSTIFDFDLIKS